MVAEADFLPKFIESFKALGISGYPLLACVIILVTVFFERVFFLFIANRPVNLKLDSSKVSSRNTVLYSLIHELNSIKNLPKDSRDEIMSISFTLAKRQLKIGLGMLKFIAAIAPMFGILGNVLGMVNSFTVISQGNGSINPAMVSGGLKEAMYATSTGLMVAMPAMFFEYFFDYVSSSRIDNYFNYINRLNIKLEIENQIELKNKNQSVVNTNRFPVMRSNEDIRSQMQMARNQVRQPNQDTQSSQSQSRQMPSSNAGLGLSKKIRPETDI